MLDWLLGRQVEDANHDEVGHDMPETPAPVFAARALKSAIFGTPGFCDEDELEEPRQAMNMNGQIQLNAQESGGLSPTKPQGILLTPGTATCRRKTVSFGDGVVDNEGKDAISKSGVPNNCPGKFPSPYTPKPRIDEDFEPVHRTSLIGSFEAARDGKSKKSSSAKNSVSSTTLSSVDLNNAHQTLEVVQSKDGKGNAPATGPLIPNEDFDGDMTLDLNEPHSQSGRYWKSEYDRYHQEAIAQMTKLVKYKQLAKSYAKKRDSEAIDLAEKLKDEQQRVAKMEAEMSELTAQIVNRRQSGQENENLMENLARRTALTREYRNQVDEFKAVLQESHTQSDYQCSRKIKRLSSTHVAQHETGLELDKATEQLSEMSFLRDEMHNIRLNLSMAEKKVSRLQDENARLAKDLTKMSDQLDKTEKGRKSAEAQSHERQMLLQGLQKEYGNLKELAKSQRREAENLLKKRHTQVAKLKKEIKILKEEAVASTPEVIKRVTSHASRKLLVSTEEEVGATDPKEAVEIGDLMSFDMPSGQERPDIGNHTKIDDCRWLQKALEPTARFLPVSSTVTYHESHIRDKQGERRSNHVLGDKLIELSRPREELLIARDSLKKGGDILRPVHTTPKHTALTELINDARIDSSKAGNQSLSGNQLSPSLQERFSSLSLNSPRPTLPSSEPSFTLAPVRTSKVRHINDSPRPSMFNIPSSPPPQLLPLRRVSGRSSHVGGNDKASSSRVSSMGSRARVTLSSDRAAAAKARLEQKNAEKRKAQELEEEKENFRM